MKRTTLLVVLLVASSAPAADRIDPTRIEVGQIGTMTTSDGIPWNFRVESVVDGSRMILALPGQPRNPILVKGMDTKGIADGKRLSLAGTWKVTGTDKIGTKTYYVVEKQTD